MLLIDILVIINGQMSLRSSNVVTNTGNQLRGESANDIFLNTSFSCKCPLFGQAESGQLIAVSRPSLIRSSTYCFRHCGGGTDKQTF